MGILADRWLSSVIGRPVFRVESPGAEAWGGAPGPGAEITAHAEEHAGAMYYARVPTTAIDVVRELGMAGFYVVDVNVTFARPTSLNHPCPGPGAVEVASIGEIDPARHADVLEIAATCFRYSRFHLDPLIPGAIANRVKREWIASYLAKQRGDDLLVATVAGRPVGFLAALTAEAEGTRIAVIDLVGVSPHVQRQGVGRALVARFLDRYRELSGRFEVGTQLANLPSLHLYERCGFAMARASYVLHKHVGA